MTTTIYPVPLLLLIIFLLVLVILLQASIINRLGRDIDARQKLVQDLVAMVESGISSMKDASEQLAKLRASTGTPLPPQPGATS